MKPKRKPMFTTLILCLTANQAVETQVPALETKTVQISFSLKDEEGPKKAEMPFLENIIKIKSASEKIIFFERKIILPTSHDREEELWTPP